MVPNAASFNRKGHHLISSLERTNTSSEKTCHKRKSFSFKRERSVPSNTLISHGHNHQTHLIQRTHGAQLHDVCQKRSITRIQQQTVEHPQRRPYQTATVHPQISVQNKHILCRYSISEHEMRSPQVCGTRAASGNTRTHTGEKARTRFFATTTYPNSPPSRKTILTAAMRLCSL